MKKKYFLLTAILLVVITGMVLSGFKPSDGARAEEESCASYYLMDYATGTKMLAYNENQKRPIASMVKIMTLLLTFDSINNGQLSLEQQITVSEKAASMGGSQMFLEAGDVYTVSDLIKGVTMMSANDASVLLGETISGSVDNFVKLMNSKTVTMGLNDTKFVNCTGLPEEGQYSTAKDVSFMMRELLKNEKYYQYSKNYMEDYVHPDGRVTQFVNTNKLVRFYADCDAGKTGFTNDAMFCLSASAKRDGLRVIATVLGADTSKNRFAKITELFNFAFANYQISKIIDTQPIENTIIVENGKSDTIRVAAERDVVVLRKTTDKDFKIDIVLEEEIPAPVSVGQKVGTLRVVDGNGVVLDEVNILSLDEVLKKTYLDALFEVIKNWSILNR